MKKEQHEKIEFMLKKANTYYHQMKSLGEPYYSKLDFFYKKHKLKINSSLLGAFIIIVIPKIWQATHPPIKPTPELFHVSVKISEMRPYTQRLYLYGTTTAHRAVTLRAETSSPVSKIRIPKGHQVKKGEILVELELENRQTQHDKAQAVLKQRDIEYKAAKKLLSQSFKSETKFAETESLFAQAKSDLDHIITEINNTKIYAPFDGFMDEQFVEVGDYLRQGDPIAKVVELTPLKITTYVSEHEINYVRTGAECTIRFPNDLARKGEVTYVGTVAQPQTRTFPVEITFQNHDFSIKAGMTAEVGIVISNDPAHLITPAVLNLNDEGTLGIKAIDDLGKVVFYPVKVLGHEEEGMWVNNLPEKLKIISVGQDYVTVGQEVIPVEESS